MKRPLLIFVIIGFFFILVIGSAQAVSRYDVLGDSTVAAELKLPENPAGPGLFLPDSPLFFLDQIFQNIKILFAGSALDKANIERDVLREREAELRLMLAKNDQENINNALNNLTDEAERAAIDLNDHAANGDDVKEAAKILNEALKHQREILDSLSDQSDGSLEYDFSSAREKVKINKFIVENHLPDSLLEDEIEDDIENEIEDEAEDTQESSRRLLRAIEVLEREASDAAKKAQTNREAVLRRVIQAKLDKLNESDTEDSEEDKEIEMAREKFKKSLEKAAEDAKKLQELQLESEAHGSPETSGSTDNTSSSGDSSSGSGGGSNSGSGSSGSSGSDSSGRGEY